MLGCRQIACVREERFQVPRGGEPQQERDRRPPTGEKRTEPRLNGHATRQRPCQNREREGSSGIAATRHTEV